MKYYLKFYYVFIKVSHLHLLISLLTILWHNLESKRLNKGFLGDRVQVLKEKTKREDISSNQFHRHQKRWEEDRKGKVKIMLYAYWNCKIGNIGLQPYTHNFNALSQRFIFLHTGVEQCLGNEDQSEEREDDRENLGNDSQIWSQTCRPASIQTSMLKKNFRADHCQPRLNNWKESWIRSVSLTLLWKQMS